MTAAFPWTMRVDAAHAQGASIGLYSDTAGNSCSLSDHTQGFFNAYVVVRPGPQGAAVVQFSAPVPACFTGAYIADQSVPGTLVIGNSQTGVSVALTTCTVFPTHVLTLQYFGYGTTPACCEYPVLPDPSNDSIAVVDCFYNTEAATGVVSLINADGTCPCGGNSAPHAPGNPVPAHVSTYVALDQLLSWTATDPDDNIADCDVYFGTDPAPPQVATGLTTTSYDPGPLEPLTTYYWRVVARDIPGLETSSEIWTFSTRAVNSPPGAPRFPIPADGATDRPVSLSIEWSCFDIDNDALTFDVYFGTAPTPPLVSPNQTPTSYSLSALAFSTTYYWRIVARDSAGHETPGPVWSFTTRPENYPPNAPAGASPSNGATTQPVNVALKWTASDPDGDELTFDVYLGTTSSPPLAAGGVGAPLYQPPTLDYATKYYWRVVVRDEHGATRDGPVWSFTTSLANNPPAVPSAPSPSNGATLRAITTTLAWACSDADGDPLVYDVYFGVETPPPLAASGVATRSFSPGLLAYSTLYYWRVVARDPSGAATSGPTWSFTTTPNPVSGSIGVYSDVTGNSCTLSDVSPGIISAYVVVRPGPTGVTAVEFSAPMPSCFTGTYLGDQSVSGTLVTGNSQDGVSVSLTGCSFGVEHVLTIQYLGDGTTPVCCEYPVLADPSVDVFAIVDCAFVTQPARNVISRFNADASCPCESNSPPGVPSNPVPANASTNRPWTQTLSWQCIDPDGDPVLCDVYFGTTSPPPLAADSLTTTSWAPDTLAFATTYYWRVIARDPLGAASTGPIWSFTTKANAPPNKPTTPSPYHGTFVLAAPLLTWNASDPDGQALTYDVYFGTEEDPPLVATGLGTRSHAPGPLQPATRYYWRVVASDGFLTTSSMVWYFTLMLQGDADQDGVLTAADAACAFRMSIYEFCGGESGYTAANVDCSTWLTPRDARCIHKHVLDGSCMFCDVGGAAPLAPSSSPVVTQGSFWEDQDTLVIELNVSGVPSLAAFRFAIIDNSYGEKGWFLRAERRGASNGWTALAGTGNSAFAIVGGYTTSYTAVVTSIPFVRFRYAMGSFGATDLRITEFTDDLAGAAPLELSFGGSVPVLVSRFEARAGADGVELRWELSGDETAERFTLLRSEGDAAGARVAGEGTVTGKMGSYLDTAVEPATTYHYELVVRTGDGNEFRSPVATVTTGSRGLALGQNHPNPFNPTTAIPYTLASGSAPARVRLIILDVAGRVVRTLVDEAQAGGSREAVWDGRDDRGGPVSSGVYFSVLDVGGERRTRKLVLLK